MNCTLHNDEVGCNFNLGEGLIFDKCHWIPLQQFVPKGKKIYYYDKIWGGLGYTTLDLSSISEESIHTHSLNSSN